MAIKKKLLLSALLLCLITGVSWVVFKPNASPSGKNYEPYTTGVKDTSPTEPLQAQVDSTPANTQNDNSTPTPIVSQSVAPPILDLDSSNYPSGKVNTTPFTTPIGDGNTWLVNFSYSSPDNGGQVSVRVLDKVNGTPLNMVILSPAPQSGRFSFYEPDHHGVVYIEVRAGSWHLNVTTADQQPLYPIVNTQTFEDLTCTKNASGQCYSGPSAY